VTRVPVLVGLALLAAGCNSGTAITEIGVGDCFDHPTEEYISALNVVDCSVEHDNEVYAEVFMDVTEYPGEDAVGEYAYDACLEAFEPYTGVGYADSPLDYLYIGPTAESWAEGDQSILCVLYSADLEKLTGSQEAG